MDARPPASDCLTRLRAEGVGIWLDGLDRELLSSGRLARLVEERSLTGLTASAGDTAKEVWAPAYRPQFADFAQRGITAGEAARRLVSFDARWACDVLLPSYRTGRHGLGLVSIDTAHTPPRTMLAEGRAAWWAVDRPNLLLKVPVSDETLPVVTGLLAEGIGVDATCVFHAGRCRQVFDAMFDGLERAAAAGRDLSVIGTAVSVPVGPVDAAVDARLAAAGAPPGRPPMGRAAQAHARLVYRAYERALGGERWRPLAERGARPPQVVWTATEALGPAGPDTRYADGLVAWGVTCAMTEGTLEAVAAHALLGGDTLSGRHVSARQDLDALRDFGVSYEAVAAELEREACASRRTLWEQLRESVAQLLEMPGA
ncbi:transaldolase family protein [Streptomyces sp. JJ36]|uniref:transaldolase family protein n=1 Tax=Streptomyces sp. JJ36 TaxID=2736645 RepID=UPI001F187EEA|nr:transaldolase family protein [Streptomyces sp. JJ36]MCF6524122.1 transaldolase [Streptomyces sp. JJ36]